MAGDFYKQYHLLKYFLSLNERKVVSSGSCKFWICDYMRQGLPNAYGKYLQNKLILQTTCDLISETV